MLADDVNVLIDLWELIRRLICIQRMSRQIYDSHHGLSRFSYTLNLNWRKIKPGSIAIKAIICFSICYVTNLMIIKYLTHHWHRAKYSNWIWSIHFSIIKQGKDQLMRYGREDMQILISLENVYNISILIRQTNWYVSLYFSSDSKYLKLQDPFNRPNMPPFVTSP